MVCVYSVRAIYSNLTHSVDTPQRSEGFDSYPDDVAFIVYTIQRVFFLNNIMSL